MFPYALPQAGVPTAALDMTAEFAPLLNGMVIGLGLCILALTLAAGFYDTWWAQRKVEAEKTQVAELPKAA